MGRCETIVEGQELQYSYPQMNTFKTEPWLLGCVYRLPKKHISISQFEHPENHRKIVSFSSEHLAELQVQSICCPFNSMHCGVLPNALAHRESALRGPHFFIQPRGSCVDGLTGWWWVLADSDSEFREWKVVGKNCCWEILHNRSGFLEYIVILMISKIRILLMFVGIQCQTIHKPKPKLTWLSLYLCLPNCVTAVIRCAQMLQNCLHLRYLRTWWFIPLTKWVITPIVSGLSLLIPVISGVITHLLSGMSPQAMTNDPALPRNAFSIHPRPILLGHFIHGPREPREAASRLRQFITLCALCP